MAIKALHRMNFFSFIFNRLHYKTDNALKLANSPGGEMPEFQQAPVKGSTNREPCRFERRFPRCALLAEVRILAV